MKEKLMLELRKHIVKRFRKHVQANMVNIIRDIIRAKPGATLSITYTMTFDAVAIKHFQKELGVLRRGKNGKTSETL